MYAQRWQPYLVLALCAACSDVSRGEAPPAAITPPRVVTSGRSEPTPAPVNEVAPLAPVRARQVTRVASAEGIRVPAIVGAQTWTPPDVQAGARVFHAVSFDGHVHSAHSRDAQHAPRAVLAYAARADLDAVILTDHGTTLGVTELVTEDRGAPVPVLSGAEIGGVFGHTVAWGFDDYTRLHDAPHQDLDAVAAIVKPAGAVLVLAHPGWWMRGNALNPRLFMQHDALRPGGRGQSIDALELWNGTYPVMSRRLVDEWAVLLTRGLYVPVVGNSDFHELGGQILGEPRNVALCPGDRETARDAIFACILDATRKGRLYVTDGPTIAATLDDQTFGETCDARPGEALTLRVRATAPQGGRLVVYVGLEVHTTQPLTPGETYEASVPITTPDSDSFVRIEIERPTRIPLHAPFTLLTNPILIDVPPTATTRRGAPLAAPQTGWPGRGMIRR